MLIKTPDDWWTLVRAHWDAYMDIFSNCGAPMGLSEKDHWYSLGIGKPVTRQDKPLIRVLEEARDDGDWKTINKWFNLCHIAAPDKPWIHEWPRWGDFCDICSESWVFDVGNDTVSGAREEDYDDAAF